MQQNELRAYYIDYTHLLQHTLWSHLST